MSYALVVYGVGIAAGLGLALYMWLSERESPHASGSSSSRCFRSLCACCYTKVPENRGVALPCGHTYHHNCLRLFREEKCETCRAYGT